MFPRRFIHQGFSDKFRPAPGLNVRVKINVYFLSTSKCRSKFHALALRDLIDLLYGIISNFYTAQCPVVRFSTVDKSILYWASAYPTEETTVENCEGVSHLMYLLLPLHTYMYKVELVFVIKTTRQI